MGLLDQIMQGLPEEHAAAGSGLPSALMNIIQNQQAGGLSGLMERFASAGLGHIFQSWVGQGPNQPIAPQDLHRALGEDQVNAMANQTGMSAGELLPLLARFLPGIVDQLTPHGQLPQGDAAHPGSAIST